MSQQGSSVQFDLSRFNWIGSPVQEPQVMWVWHTTGIRSIAGLRDAKIIMGGTSAGADNHTLPVVINHVFGTKIDVVLGYKGPNEIFLAAERGEVHGISTAHSTLMANRYDWVRDGKVNILVQFGGTRMADLPDVPTAIEIAPDADGRQLLEFIASKFVMARPYAVPPNTPMDRVKALRDAFDATMKDAAFLRDAEKVSLMINPVSGEDMHRLIGRIEMTPDMIVEQIREILRK